MRAFIPACAIALGFVATAHAAPVDGVGNPGNVIPDIIFGSGNGNGSFTGQIANNIEVGLRGKQRYPAADIFNYDGDHTYTFDSSVLTTNPANRSVFNFEWSINVDATNSTAAVLSDYDYELSFDVDYTAGISMVTIDPFNTAGYFDHSLGVFGTPNGGGDESASLAELMANMGFYDVAQQSSNLGFGFSSDPDHAGIYEFQLNVKDKTTGDVLSSAAITVVVQPVPLPAALPMLASALALAGLIRRRRKA